MFSEAPTLNARTRALHRLLNIHKHQSISREQWFGFGGLQPHTEGHLSSTDSASIIGAYVSARSRTGTDLSSYQVLTFYCAVSTMIQNRALPLTTSLATYQLSLHIWSRRSDAWDKLRRCSVTDEPFLQPNRICCVRRKFALRPLYAKATSRRRGHSMLRRCGHGRLGTTADVEIGILLRLLL
jgi:hypothetical protein